MCVCACLSIFSVSLSKYPTTEEGRKREGGWIAMYNNRLTYKRLMKQRSMRESEREKHLILYCHRYFCVCVGWSWDNKRAIYAFYIFDLCQRHCVCVFVYICVCFVFGGETLWGAGLVLLLPKAIAFAAHYKSYRSLKGIVESYCETQHASCMYVAMEWVKWSEIQSSAIKIYLSMGEEQKKIFQYIETSLRGGSYACMLLFCLVCAIVQKAEKEHKEERENTSKKSPEEQVLNEQKRTRVNWPHFTSTPKVSKKTVEGWCGWGVVLFSPFQVWRRQPAASTNKIFLSPRERKEKRTSWIFSPPLLLFYLTWVFHVLSSDWMIN